MNEKPDRLVCACGTPIPTDRAGSEHCGTDCEWAEAERQRAAEWQGLMNEEAVRMSEWVREQMLRRAEI
jgi:hypothetical protein